MSNIDNAVKHFKNAAEKPSVSKGYISITESLRAEIKNQLGDLSMDIRKQLKIYDESINILKDKMDILLEKEITRKTQIDTAIHIFKFLFGGGCLLTVINIIVLILVTAMSK